MHHHRRKKRDDDDDDEEDEDEGEGEGGTSSASVTSSKRPSSQRLRKLSDSVHTMPKIDEAGKSRQPEALQEEQEEEERETTPRPRPAFSLGPDGETSDEEGRIKGIRRDTSVASQTSMDQFYRSDEERRVAFTVVGGKWI